MSQPDTSTLAGKIAVMQAALEGKVIEIQQKRSTDKRWGNCASPWWEWQQFDYRIKPQEPLRCWVNVFPGNRLGWAHEHFIKAESNCSGAERGMVPLIELTPEIEACLKANGLL